MSEVQESIARWAGECAYLLYDLHDLSQRAIKRGVTGVPSPFSWFVNGLTVSCHLTSESTVLLVAHGRLWDAEILLRSVTEGSLKVAFLCAGDEAERATKAEEYGKTLPDIATIRRHQRLSAFFETVDDPDSPDWEQIKKILVSAEELLQLERAYPRKVRQRIEERWSFFKIIEAFSKPDARLPGLAPARVLLYPYLMASHQTHQDADGVRLIWDRTRRSDARRLPLERAHAARELSDLAAMALIRTYAVLVAHGGEHDAMKQTFQRYDQLTADLAEARRAWWDVESQYTD